MQGQVATSPFLLLLSLFLLQIYLKPGSCLGHKILILRPRSRHTSLIYPLDVWTTPLLEIQELVRAQRGVESEKVGDGACSLVFQHIGDLVYRVKEQKEVQTGVPSFDLHVSKCVLVHSLHEEIASGSSPFLASERALENMELVLPPNSRKSVGELSYFVAAIISGDAYLSNEEIESNIIDGFRDLWDRLGRGNRVSREKDANISYRVIVVDNATESAHKDEERSGKTYLLVRPLARGLGASTYMGEGCREMLASSTANRRAGQKGIFKKYSLQHFPYKSKTAMEPEVALLMSSFAHLRAGARVLDPFCGSAMLLLACCVQEPSCVTVGIDASREAIDSHGIKSNFEHLNLLGSFEKLSLFHGFVSELASDYHGANVYTDSNTDSKGLNILNNQRWITGPDHDLDSSKKFDAIIADPPYDMNEKAQVKIDDGEGEMSNQSAHGNKIVVGRHTVFRDLIRLSTRALLKGGRLVFFLPQRGGGESCEELLDALLHDELKKCLCIRHCIRQQFSPTFSRWLVVMERL